MFVDDTVCVAQRVYACVEDTVSQYYIYGVLCLPGTEMNKGSQKLPYNG